MRDRQTERETERTALYRECGGRGRTLTVNADEILPAKHVVATGGLQPHRVNVPKGVSKSGPAQRRMIAARRAARVRADLTRPHFHSRRDLSDCGSDGPAHGAGLVQQRGRGWRRCVLLYLEVLVVRDGVEIDTEQAAVRDKLEAERQRGRERGRPA